MYKSYDLLYEVLRLDFGDWDLLLARYLEDGYLGPR